MKNFFLLLIIGLLSASHVSFASEKSVVSAESLPFPVWEMNTPAPDTEAQLGEYDMVLIVTVERNTESNAEDGCVVKGELTIKTEKNKKVKVKVEISADSCAEAAEVLKTMVSSVSKS